MVWANGLFSTLIKNSEKQSGSEASACMRWRWVRRRGRGGIATMSDKKGGGGKE